VYKDENTEDPYSFVDEGTEQRQPEVQLHLLLSSQSKLSPPRVQHLKSVDERRKSYPNQSQGIINIDFDYRDDSEI
jgi:hypothetical protein